MMSIEDSLELQTDWDSRCVVCGKSVEGNAGLCHIKVEGRMIALCCPLCIETFNKDPKHYLALRASRELHTAKPHAESSSLTWRHEC